MVVTGVNGKRNSTPGEYERLSYAVSRVLNAKIIGKYFALAFAIFTTKSHVYFALIQPGVEN